MGFGMMAVGGLWAGVFSAAMAVLLTAPPRYAPHVFLCSFVGRVSRDLFMSWGLTKDWSTVIAAALIVLVAVAVLRGRAGSPVILVTSVLPLGAAVAMFNAIAGLMRVASLEGEALEGASIALIANTGNVFTSTLAIALGLALGTAIVRAVRRQAIWESA